MYKKLMEFIFFVVLITMMVMSLNLAVADSTAMDIATLELLKYTFLIVLAAALFVRFPITLLGAAAVLLGGGIYAYAEKLVIPSELISYFRGFFTWLPQYVIGYEAFELQYSLLFAILYILLTTLFITFIVFNKRGYGLLIALGAGAFAFFWFIFVSKARLYLFYYLFAALILYSYNVYDKKKKEWISAESKIDKYIELKWIFNSFMIVVVSILISQFAALDIKPIQWTWLSDKAVQAFPFIENWRNDNLDSYSFRFGSRYGIDAAGYRTAKLGGPVKLSDRIMLVVESSDTNNLYLRGSIKDLYIGNSWSKTKKSSTPYDSDSLPPMPWAENAAYIKEFKVTHQGLITSTIFAPNTLRSVAYKINKYYIDQDDEAFFPRTLARKDSYYVESELPYIDVEQLKKLKAVSELDSYKQLPDTISNRVRQLALDITSKYSNDYDKAKAIEDYLRSNYKYTLKPSEIPEGSEFTDYFLFEGREGYCTYFATSMAVLLRAADIPCRYVEGFLAKYDGSYVRNVPGTDAHAWVEVNFGPYGWLTFEATPAYPLAGFRTQGEVHTALISELESNEPAAPAAQAESASRDRNLELTDEEGAADEQQSKEISLNSGIFLTIIGILILRILYLVSKRIMIELSIRKAAGKQYAAMYFNDILRHLKKVNVKMEKEDTMREFWYELKYLLEDSYQNGDAILQLLEKARYGSEKISPEERNQLEEYRKMVKKFVTARLGTIKALIGYYIMGF